MEDSLVLLNLLAPETNEKTICVMLWLLEFIARGDEKDQKVERCESRDRSVDDKGQESQSGHHGVRQEVLEHDGGIRQAKRPSGANVLEIAGA